MRGHSGLACHSRRGFPLRSGAVYIPRRPRPWRRGLLLFLELTEKPAERLVFGKEETAFGRPRQGFEAFAGLSTRRAMPWSPALFSVSMAAST